MATIQKIDIPRSKKEVQSFLGNVIILRRFIPNFVEIVKCITNMLRKKMRSKRKWKPKNILMTLKKN